MTATSLYYAYLWLCAGPAIGVTALLAFTFDEVMSDE